jgi:hypothetical protein
LPLPALAALLVLLIAWIRHQIYSLGELRLTPHSGETFLTTLMPSCRPRPPTDCRGYWMRLSSFRRMRGKSFAYVYYEDEP